MQAWNLHFHAPDCEVHLSFLVLHLGPGNSNNAAAALLRGCRENAGADSDRFYSAAYEARSLRARPGQIDLRLGRSTLKARPDGSGLRARIVLPDVELELRWNAIRPGVRLADGPRTSRTNRADRTNRENRTGREGRGISTGARIWADLPVRHADARLELLERGELDRQRLRTNSPEQLAAATVALRGAGGLEHFRSDGAPLDFADTLLVTRSLAPGPAIFLGGYTSADGGFDLRFAALEPVGGREARIYAGGRVMTREVLERRRIPGFSGHDSRGLPWRIRSRVQSSDGIECELDETRFAMGPRTEILQSAPALLRWLIAALYASPRVLHFRSRIRLDCVDPDGGRFMRVYDDLLSSAYQTR